MAKSVFSKDEAEKISVAYSPKKFPFSVAKSAIDFIAGQKPSTSKNSGFMIDPIVAEQTGIAKIERESLEARVERGALERLKEIQEHAYQEAYQLGLAEGRDKAFKSEEAQFRRQFAQFETLIASIDSLKTDLIRFNEAHIMKLVYEMVRRVVMAEVKQDKNLIFEVIRSAVESAQGEENITVRLSAEDLKMVQEMREKLGRDFDSIKRTRLEASESIANGGCIVVTNFGVIDATIEQRLGKLWQTFVEKIPLVQDEIAVEPKKSDDQ